MIILGGKSAMKRIIVIALACAFAPLAGAQLYKSVDSNGKTVYSDQPPPNADAKQITVQPSAAPATKTAVERDKDVEKARIEARDKGKKAELAAKNSQINEARCVQARSAYQTYTDGGRIAKTNEKGERIVMSDAEIEVERNNARTVMDEACKK
jgi:hypothetical protein